MPGQGPSGARHYLFEPSPDQFVSDGFSGFGVTFRRAPMRQRSRHASLGQNADALFVLDKDRHIKLRSNVRKGTAGFKLQWRQPGKASRRNTSWPCELLFLELVVFRMKCPESFSKGIINSRHLWAFLKRRFIRAGWRSLRPRLCRQVQRLWFQHPSARRGQPLRTMKTSSSLDARLQKLDAFEARIRPLRYPLRGHAAWNARRDNSRFR